MASFTCLSIFRQLESDGVSLAFAVAVSANADAATNDAIMILVGDITPSVFYDRQRCRCVGHRWDLRPSKGVNIIKTVTTA
jgi:hypothetical protein